MLLSIGCSYGRNEKKKFNCFYKIFISFGSSFFWFYIFEFISCSTNWNNYN